MLDWLAATMRDSGEPRAVLDVGCGYGNHLFMLNAALGKPESLTLVGTDLSDNGFPFDRSFAERMPGYQNCRFQIANLEEGLPFEESSFGTVNFSDVLEHMERPEQALGEIARILEPGGTTVISTPLRTSLFKSLAKLLNRFTGRRLSTAYYAGKGTTLDDAGRPITETHAGHVHIAEMNYGEFLGLVSRCGLKLVKVGIMPIMSGSTWFDRHPFLSGSILTLEALHDRIRFPAWAHSVCLRIEKTKS